jgi:hypothetical protein
LRLYIQDVKDTHGGLGKKGRIVVELASRGRFVVTEANKDIFAALAVTASRAEIAGT